MNSVGIVHRGMNGLPETGLQVLCFNQAPFANNDRALQGIPQLPDVARPGVALKQIQDRFAHIRHFALVLFAHLRQKRFHQVSNVVLVFAQRRHINVEDVKAVIKILAQFSGRYRFIWNLVGSREDADIHRSLHLTT